MNKQKLTTKADQKKHKNKQTQNKIKQKKNKEITHWFYLQPHLISF